MNASNREPFKLERHSVVSIVSEVGGCAFRVPICIIAVTSAPGEKSRPLCAR
jgi:hypothetical protein